MWKHSIDKNHQSVEGWDWHLTYTWLVLVVLVGFSVVSDKQVWNESGWSGRHQVCMSQLMPCCSARHYHCKFFGAPFTTRGSVACQDSCEIVPSHVILGIFFSTYQEPPTGLSTPFKYHETICATADLPVFHEPCLNDCNVMLAPGSFF